MRLPILLSLVACLGACGPADKAPTRPNVVLFTLDTTRPDYLSCYSADRTGTPTLEGVAARGTLFEAAISASGVTPVSHASILTGRFPYEHGLRVLSAGSGFRLGKDQPTLASALREQGYRTAAIQSAFPVSGYFGFQKDFDIFEDLRGEMRVDEKLGKTVWDGDKLQRRSDETASLVLRFLDDEEQDQRPFFLWVHLWDPHDPWIKPPPEYTSHLTLDERQFVASSQQYAQVYAAEVRFMDRQIGSILDGLTQRGLRANTLLCITADHGEGLADCFAAHGWSKHRMNYQQQLHVPLLLEGPGVPAGKVIPDMVRTVDIAPTLLDLAGFPGALTSISGRSLRPLLEGKTLQPVHAYADQINGYDANASMVRNRPDAAFLYTVCDGVWKLIYRPHMPDGTELFNLQRDPEERRNVIHDNPGVALRLLADLAARNPWVLHEFPVEGEGFSPDVAAGLAGLGYGGGGGGDTGNWWWTCPAHPDYRRETRVGPGGTLRHGENGCTQPVVPRTTFTPMGVDPSGKGGSSESGD